MFVASNRVVNELMLESDAKYKKLLEGVPDRVWEFDDNEIFTFCSTSYEHILGYKPEELLGKSIYSIMPKEDVQKAKEEFDDIKQLRSTFTNVVKHNLSTKSELRHLLSSGVPLIDTNGKFIGYIGIDRDITERVKAQEELELQAWGLNKANEGIKFLYSEIEASYVKLRDQSSQLMQAEKMSTVGTLASGVAHELNNPLMGVLGFTQYCLKHTSNDDKRYAVLQDIEQEALRCISIVENLLTFSHMGKEGIEERQDASCADILERVLKLLSYRIEKERVTIIKQYANGSPDARIQVNGIQQVFLNVISNALDALEDCTKKEIHIYVKHREAFTVITIADTGGGIPSQHLERIFEPFFTTKTVGKGTGLGLSLSKSIVDGNNGKLTCESEVGKGTKFIIRLLKNKNRE
jgi:PAS domain S-box-containing protein